MRRIPPGLDIALVSVGLILLIAGCSSGREESGRLEGAVSLGTPTRGEAYGCARCSAPARFGELVQISYGTQGAVYVVDRYPPFVKVLREGAVQPAVSRGQGPGEAMRPSFVFPLANGGFLLVDEELRRVSLFDANASFLGGGTIAIGRVVGADYVFEESRLFLLAGDVINPRVNVRVVEIDMEGYEESMLFRVAGMTGYPSFAAAPGPRFAVAKGEIYDFPFLDSDGSEAARVSRQVERVPIPEAELERLRERAQRLYRNKAGVSIEDTRRHFYADAFDFDSSGRLWILTSRGEATGGAIFDVFAPIGDYLETVEIDDPVKNGCSCFDVRDGSMAIISRDPAGTDSVRIWHFESPSFP